MRNLGIVLALLVCPLAASGASVILNEWNCVGDEEYLDGAGSGKSDTFFGMAAGNGKDWIELVVTEDNVDMCGWTFNWQDLNSSGVVSTGVITLSNNSLWQNMRMGTILTFIEDNPAVEGIDTGTDTGTAYRTDSLGDWWINVCTTEEQFKSASEQLCYTDTVEGNFKVNSDHWQLTIRNASNIVIQGPIGEDFIGQGINNKEVGKLEANPTTSVALASYNDGTSSSFGSPNIWSGGTITQDFSVLRSWAPVPEPLTLSLLAMGGMMIFRKKR